jgi:hypothetical protein
VGFVEDGDGHGDFLDEKRAVCITVGGGVLQAGGRRRGRGA